MEEKLYFEVDCASVTVGRKFTAVLLYFTLYLRAISKYKPPGGFYLEGRFNGRVFALQVWGAYTWRGLLLEFYGNCKWGHFRLRSILLEERFLLARSFLYIIINRSFD